MTTETAKEQVPLIIEDHPVGYTGFPFITLIQYRKQPMLTVVDNIDDDVIRAFVLDMCGPERVSEELIVSAAADWYENHRTMIPLSIHLSREGLTPITSKIYRALNVEFVSRVIGPIHKYPFTSNASIKRRRRKAIPPTIEINYQSDKLFQ